ncbi:MAG TPA: hypothetical protein EYG83_07780 [Sulfurospirillum arcachonense]|nr:hypothetical protein [Sulfurospirillum arcachonense]
MNNYVNFLDKFKYKLIILITVIVALLSISLKNLDYEGSYKIWFDQDSKIIKDYESFRSTFSGDDRFAIAFEDKNGIFTEKAINVILDLTKKLHQIKGVQKVDSLTNYQHISSFEDDIIIENFIVNTQNLDEKKRLALTDDLILNQLISKSATTTMLSVKLANDISSNEEVNIYVMEEIQKILNTESEETNYKFYTTGVPAITASLVTISQHDAMILMPMAVVIVVILLFLIFRNIIGVLVPSVVVVFTFLTVLSIQILLGYKLNNFTVNIPSFISAITIADAMHLYLGWVYYKLSGENTKKAVHMALEKNLLPIALTSITTAIGFASLGFSEIEPISTLGIAITSGALLAFVFSITIVPAILLLLPEEHPVGSFSFINFSNIKGYGAFISRNDKKIVFSFVFLFAILIYGLNFIKVDSNSIKYFGEDTTVRSGANFLEKELTGAMVYEVILNSKQREGAKNPKFLNTIVKFEKELAQRYNNITFDFSLKDIVVRMQNVLNKEALTAIPKSQNLVAQYLLLYSMSLPQGMEINDKIDTTEQYLRLTLNSNIQDTSKDLEMISWIESWWEGHHYAAEVQGQTMIFAHMQSSITDTLIFSISLTLLIVILLMYFIFRNIKMLWIFILPNIAPIVLVLGIMGYAGLNIDIGIAISAAVILGISVDDTIHFFTKYFDAIKTKSFEESIDHVLKYSGSAMILTTIILSFTFSIFMFSSFVPNVNFAIVTICALNIALLLDLVLLPALLSLFFNKK